LGWQYINLLNSTFFTDSIIQFEFNLQLHLWNTFARFIHNIIAMDLEKPQRRVSLTSQRSIAIGVDLEKDWDHDLEKRSTSESDSIQEPEKARTNEDGDEQDGSIPRRHDLEGAPVHRTVTAQDWTGPDDPENPHNWSLWKRIWHTIPPALLAFTV
jgi:hypothetical protein